LNFTNSFTLRETGEKEEYFVGMNTGRGFVGKYSEIIQEKKLKRLYIIKGAAGTGKSTLMKRCAIACEEIGYKVSYYRCSSDPDSLDCVVINDSVSILDGTKPHSLDMTYPGAVSQLVDVTSFWDSYALRGLRDEIIRITDEKKVAFTDGYSLLSDISGLAMERYNSSIRFVLLDKLDKYITRLITAFGKSRGIGERRQVIIRSVGMNGCVRLNTLEHTASTIIKVNDVYASAYHFMDMLAGRLTKSGYDIITSPDPITPELICDIFIPQNKTLITLDSSLNADKQINMIRFVDTVKLSETRGIMRLSLKCSEALLSEAVNVFKNAGKAHFKLEQIYSSAMDFGSLNAYVEELNNRIISEL